MENASREAKTNTSWTNPNPVYHRALAGFVEAILNDLEFTADLQNYGKPLIQPGGINSLSQALIKLTGARHP